MAVCAGGQPTPWREYSPCPLPAGAQTAPHPGCPAARGGLAVRPGSRSGQRGRYVSNRKPPTLLLTGFCPSTPDPSSSSTRVWAKTHPFCPLLRILVPPTRGRPPRVDSENDTEMTEVDWARARLSRRIYVSKSFPVRFSKDAGHPGRYIYKVFDDAQDPEQEAGALDWENSVFYTSPGGRKQLQLQVARTSGVVRKIRIQRVPTDPSATKLENILELDRAQSTALIDLIKSLESIPIEGDTSVRVDDRIIREVFADPDTIGRIYAHNPEHLKALIQSDATAQDVLALANRRKVVDRMTAWLEDAAAFKAAAAFAGGAEKAWQQLFEENPWILGVGLSGQLFTSWDESRLEQVTTGADISTRGKRVDALLRTSGIVRSMVFAEIKRHDTPLLASKPYRSASWPPSDELAGAIVQSQQTVHKAAREIGDFLQDTAGDGSRLSSGTYLIQPRSFLVIGSLSQLHGQSGGPLDDKVHSFELLRSHTVRPEIITFDELLARAKWNVELAERGAANASVEFHFDPTTGEVIED